MDVNEALRTLRKALWRPDQDPSARLRSLDAAARELDGALSEGGKLPDDWREDRVSSASRQHYIETGRYLTRDDYAAGHHVDALYEVASGVEAAVLDDLYQRVVAHSACPTCGEMNIHLAAECGMCGTLRPEQEAR